MDADWVRQSRYPIHGEAGFAWILVFDPDHSGWFVDEITATPAGRRRVALDIFEQSDVGRKLEARLRDALARAVDDA